MSDPENNPFAAPCGLFCPACTLYIATTQDPARLRRLAEAFGLPEEEMRCLGCRSEVRGPYCRTCAMVTCADEKGVRFCAQCPEYPCGRLSEFQSLRPHRLDLFEDGARIRKAGFGTWFREAAEKYSCVQCGILNSAYDLKCRGCGREPASPFVERHWETLAATPSPSREPVEE